MNYYPLIMKITIINISSPNNKGQVTLLAEGQDGYYTKLVSITETVRWSLGKDLILNTSWKKSL